jgi:outer membrane protein assembly factor BamB
MRLRQFLLTGLAALLLTGPAAAGDWPGWRGPYGDGTCDDPAVPLRWSETENVGWKVPVPGNGHSSPIVWGERVFLTTAVDTDRVLLCVDRRDGRTLWKRTVLTAPIEKMHANNSPASATPVTDGQHVWVTFLDAPNMVAACFTVDGDLVWKKAVGEYLSQHGFCSSPVLYKDLLILNGDSDGDAFLAALEPRTGRERWRTARPNRTRSFSTPLVIDVHGRPQMVLSGSKSIAAFDPATGEPLWVVDSPTDKFVATVACADGVVLATGTSPAHTLVGIRPDGRGNVTKTHVLWGDLKGAAYVPSPVAIGRHFFLVSDAGIASCIEARTGKKLWTERLGARHKASPLVIGKYVYSLADDGQMFVLKADTRFEVVSRNRIDGNCHATPAVSRGQLFIRTTEYLYCIGAGGR